MEYFTENDENSEEKKPSARSVASVTRALQLKFYSKTQQNPQHSIFVLFLSNIYSFGVCNVFHTKVEETIDFKIVLAIERYLH